MLVFHCNYPVTKEVMFSTKTSWQEHLRCTWRILETASQSSLDPFQPPESYFILNSALRVASTSSYLVRKHDSACWSTSDFPGGSDGKVSAYNAEDPRFNPWIGRISCRRKWQPSPVFLPGKSHGQRSLVGYSPSGRKESDATERLHVYQLRKAATSPPIEDLQVQCACVWICTCAHERAKREQGVKERNAASM